MQSQWCEEKGMLTLIQKLRVDRRLRRRQKLIHVLRMKYYDFEDQGKDKFFKMRRLMVITWRSIVKNCKPIVENSHQRENNRFKDMWVEARNQARESSLRIAIDFGKQANATGNRP